MCTDYEPNKVYQASMRHAAWARRCAECGRTIQRGERYEHVFAVEYGETKGWTFNTCPHCVSAREWLRIVCQSWMHGMLAWELQEHADEYPWITPRWLRTAVACIGRRWTTADGRLMNPMGVPKIPAEMVPDARRLH